MASVSLVVSPWRDGGSRSVWVAEGRIQSFDGAGDGIGVWNGVGAGVTFFIVPPVAAVALALALALIAAAKQGGRRWGRRCAGWGGVGGRGIRAVR